MTNEIPDVLLNENEQRRMARKYWRNRPLTHQQECLIIEKENE